MTTILTILLLALLIFWWCYREIRNALVLPNRRPRRNHRLAMQLKHYMRIRMGRRN